MLHFITCHGRIMPRLAELLVILFYFLYFDNTNSKQIYFTIPFGDSSQSDNDKNIT